MPSACADDRLLIERQPAPRTTRTLALAVSCALHVGGVLALLPRQSEFTPLAEAIEVSLVAADGSEPAGDMPSETPAEAAEEAMAARSDSQPPEAVGEQSVAPDPSAAPPSDAVAAKEPPPEDRKTIAPATPPTASAPASASDADPRQEARKEIVRAYAGAVSAELKRRRIYPAAARARGIAGAAKVAFALDAFGRVSSFRIVASSGHALLDASIGKIMDSVRMPPPPDGAFDAVVTIRFGLK